MSAYDDAVAYLDAVCSDMRDIVDEMEDENAKLRQLVQRNYHIAMSEREALRVSGFNPDDGAYITALDETIRSVEEQMRALGIEVDDE